MRRRGRRVGGHLREASIPHPRNKYRSIFMEPSGYQPNTAQQAEEVRILMLLENCLQYWRAKGMGNRSALLMCCEVLSSTEQFQSYVQRMQNESLVTMDV